jgi:hypothetical protein
MNKVISRNNTKVTGPMKIAGLAYNSQPGWSGLVLRTSAVTWQLSQKPESIPFPRRGPQTLTADGRSPPS